jgi:hypothetical protein
MIDTAANSETDSTGVVAEDLEHPVALLLDRQ